MKRTVVNTFLSLLFVAVLISQGCSDEVEITEEVIVPENPKLAILTSEIGYSAVIDGTKREIENFDQLRGNGVDSTWYNGLCGSPFFSLKNQQFHFSNFPTVNNKYGLTFNMYKCADIFTDSLEKDSILFLGNYDFGNAFGSEGASVSFIDDTLGFFSTELSPKPDSQDSTTSFVITDMVRNTDGFSRYIIAGTFECYIYNINGDSLIIRDGKFVSRAGRDY